MSERLAKKIRRTVQKEIDVKQNDLLKVLRAYPINKRIGFALKIIFQKDVKVKLRKRLIK